MANKTEEQLLNLFNEASGDANSKGPASGSSDAVGDAALVDASKGHADSASDYAGGSAGASSFDPSRDSGAGESYDGTSGSSGASQNSSGGGSTLESLAGSVFGGAMGLIPLVGSLFGLFDSKSTQQPIFQKYEMASSISFEAADTGSGLVNADYGQMGLPRVYDSSDSDGSSGSGGASAASPASSGPTAGSGSGAGASNGASASGTPQISVNVQAMDAQSFMSYSGEIAKAVRDAMLNLSSINDVVTDL